MKRVIQVVFIALIVVVITVPFIFANRENNKVSETEKRYLSNLPTANFGTEDWKEQFETWLGDNIAFREQFINLRSILLYKGFQVVSSEKIMRGKDGWLFYTYDNNINIAKGEYVIDDESLKQIATKVIGKNTDNGVVSWILKNYK